MYDIQVCFENKDFQSEFKLIVIYFHICFFSLHVFTDTLIAEVATLI